MVQIYIILVDEKMATQHLMAKGHPRSVGRSHRMIDSKVAVNRILRQLLPS